MCQCDVITSAHHVSLVTLSCSVVTGVQVGDVKEFIGDLYGEQFSRVAIAR